MARAKDSTAKVSTELEQLREKHVEQSVEMTMLMVQSEALKNKNDNLKAKLERHDKNLEQLKEVKFAMKGKEASTQTETVEEEAANKSGKPKPEEARARALATDGKGGTQAVDKDCEKEDLAEEKLAEEKLQEETRGTEDRKRTNLLKRRWQRVGNLNQKRQRFGPSPRMVRVEYRE